MNFNRSSYHFATLVIPRFRRLRGRYVSENVSFEIWAVGTRTRDPVRSSSL